MKRADIVRLLLNCRLARVVRLQKILKFHMRFGNFGEPVDLLLFCVAVYFLDILLLLVGELQFVHDVLVHWHLHPHTGLSRKSESNAQQCYKYSK